MVQRFQDGAIDDLLGDCLTLTYNAVHFAEVNGISNRTQMKQFYRTLKGDPLPSCYKVATITRACAVVRSRKKGEKRRVSTKHPNPLGPTVCIISVFFITAKGRLFIPLRRDKYVDVLLNNHVQQTLAGEELRSLTMTPDSLSFCYSEDVEPSPVKTAYGVDRNEKNMTFGDRDGVIQVDMAKAVTVRQTTREVLGSFRRDDVRVGRRLARKCWKRADQRTGQMLHAVTNFMVGFCVKNGAALALEDLTGIGKMYRRGSGQGADYRFRLNARRHWKAKHMLEYKAAWKGVTVVQLNKSDTHGSASRCSACGESLRGPDRDDAEHRGTLWCQSCKGWIDRDVNAALNLSARGLTRFASSLPLRPKSLATTDVAEGEKGWQLKRRGGTRRLLQSSESMPAS
ncbi:MAG: transposase [Nitrososphaerota archaeon]|nr:transposase [Nitrososphaerota archaeon]